MVFETEEQLVEHINKNLQEQRNNGVAEKDLVIRINTSVYYMKELIIIFNFDMRSLMKKLNLKLNKEMLGGYEVNHKIDFSCTTFSSVANFSCTTFSSVANFSHATFNSVTYFSYATFNSVTYFSYATFNSVTYFQSSSISNIISLEYIKCISKNASLIFDDIVFENEKSSLYLSMRNDREYKKLNALSMQNVLINGRIDIRKLQCNNTNFKGTAITGVFTAIDCDFGEFKNWQTVRFFKHEAIKINDTIKALEYKADEVRLYKNELVEDFKNKDNITLQKIAEFASIMINGFFSNHGQNWLQAVGATFLVGVLFYNIGYFFNRLFIPKNYNVDYILFFNGLIKYFIPFDFTFIDKYNPLSNVILLLGKIATWYGGVQVVSAFRKYNKY